MAGTVTISEERYGSVKAVRFAWTSSAGGAADGTTTYAYNGEVLRLVTIPDGVDVPTASYDVVMDDADAADILGGLGADRSDTATEWRVFTEGLGAIANDKITLHVTNAGDTKKGVAVVYIR